MNVFFLIPYLYYIHNLINLYLYFVVSKHIGSKAQIRDLYSAAKANIPYYIFAKIENVRIEISSTIDDHNYRSCLRLANKGLSGNRNRKSTTHKDWRKYVYICRSLSVDLRLRIRLLRQSFCSGPERNQPKIDSTRLEIGNLCRENLERKCM